jgi:hypothetical protein
MIAKMATKKLLALMAFSFLVLASPTQVKAASILTPDPEFYFYPAKPWSAGKMSEASGAAPGSCAIQSQFNNGYILQFDGSSRWVENFSLNFRQNIFEAGKAYPLTLSVPGGISATLEATAISPSIIQANLNEQKNFYDAIQTAAAMDVNVQGNAFRFYLVGFAEAAKSFETCMGGAAIQTADAKIEVSKDEVLAKSDDKFNESIAFEQKEKDNAHRAEKEVKPVSALTPETPPVMAAPVATVEAESTPSEMPAPGRAKITRDIKKIEADFTQMGEDDQTQAVNTAFNHTSPASGNFVETDIVSNYGDKISELEKQLRVLESENIALKDELQTALQEGKTEQTQISNENWNLERASMRYQEAERQLKKLGGELQKQKAQCEVEKRELEAMLFDPQVTNQQQLARLADLEEQLAEAEEKLANMRLQSAAREAIRDELANSP